MFIQPFDTSLSMWFVPIPQFEWVPVQPPPPDASCGDAVAPPTGDEPGPMPPMQLVMTGFNLCMYRVWNAVPNVDWQVYMDNLQTDPERDADADDRRITPRPPVPVVRPAAVDGAAAATSAPDGDPAP